ncbi:MAG TPA: 3-phosphoserine/phosphohydroxythreonine transaminase [Bacteroidales bacterium]|jgi:phosphoserine aminotransferase|nr:3-phosphoserine/phosphohydroxythreonine transaminase [Bacteroidales bacterium]OQB65014.1 MAG: Phosphoserine aminotransferase [Bacteroidetes bacterium ADurb.Bin145]HOU01586.1 3-phosphoserine/phosphohydroxythreonine transaminase [Bacteroidales bacterium]HQG62417.1 3-phosphoserine/phosphohydroxythreonine transaminase [Bacteroidales bacterium]HQK66970.1 3-phosphoserine/phosphohydroxythreonine transaminase [Bacteroidales bacterium]
MKKHNFYAGPSILPQYTLDKTIEGIRDFAGTGLSIMEISHRSKEFIACMNDTIALAKELLEVPSGYQVIFLGGGASMQFAMVPMNLMVKKSAYLVTGEWASKAFKEAKIYGEAVEVASSKDKNFNYIPKNYTVPADADYFHITTNNTIFGTELKKDPDVKVPMVADMSSDIFSRPVDVAKYAIIYAGAQKNMGPAGVAMVIIREDALGKVTRPIPTILDYRTHIKSESMFNTPPCINVFAVQQTLQYLKDLGGVKVMQKKNIEKAAILYDEIDRNKLFVPTIADPEDRSIMNICFVMAPEYKELEQPFSDFAKSKGMVGIAGHRSVGGFRASTYNALPKESVQALVDVMKEFEKKN